MFNLVEIKQPDFDVDLYIAYATGDNFTGKPLYKSSNCYLHKDAAKCLHNAIGYSAQLGLRLKIFDAYRPIEVQQELWDDNPDPDFISNPTTGAVPHCRGVAVDLTLINPDGSELDMGSGFDSFSPRSFHGNMEISPVAQKNRHLLMGIMTTAGWDFYRKEWWHYQLFEPRKYPAINDSEARTGLFHGR
jgi:D-alanyl-D-alanine dipeptidase